MPSSLVGRTTLNGQRALASNDPRLIRVQVPGTKVALTVHKEFAPIALYIARQWHATVQPLIPGECGGYNLRETSSGQVSSHASGFTIDLNWGHAGRPLWGDDKLPASPAQLRAMHAIKKKTGCLWGGPSSYGGNYTQPKNWDPMHWDIPPGVDAVKWCRAVIRRLALRADGSQIPVRPSTPKPVPKPTPKPPARKVDLTNVAPGKKNSDIRLVQQVLRAQGKKYRSLNPSGATGLYGQETRDMVRLFEKAHFKNGDGVIGFRVLRLLGKSGGFTAKR